MRKFAISAIATLLLTGCVHRATRGVQEMPLVPKDAPKWVKRTETFWASKNGDTLYFKGMALRVQATNVNAVIDAAELDALKAIVQSIQSEIQAQLSERSDLTTVEIRKTIEHMIKKTNMPGFRHKVYVTEVEQGYTLSYSAWVLFSYPRKEYENLRTKALDAIQKGR